MICSSWIHFAVIIGIQSVVFHTSGTSSGLHLLTEWVVCVDEETGLGWVSSILSVQVVAGEAFCASCVVLCLTVRNRWGVVANSGISVVGQESLLRVGCCDAVLFCNAVLKWGVVVGVAHGVSVVLASVTLRV